MSSPVESILNAVPPFDSSRLSFSSSGPVFANLPSATLLEHAVRRREGVLTDLGALSAFTGSRTGRSPKDKLTVKEPSVADQIDWTANQAMDPETFNQLRDRVRAYLSEPRTVRLRRVRLCRPDDYRLPLRVVIGEGVAQPLRPVPVPAADARTAAHIRPRVDDPARVRLPRRPGPRRHQVRSLRRDQLRAETRGRVRHALRGRDQEGDVHGPELPAPAEGRLPDALLRERGARRRRRAVLRAVGDGQDDAQCRPGTPADRRRRTRLGR